MSIFWQIQIAISFDWKKINAFCLFYSIMHSLGLQDIIMDKVVSKNHFLRNVLMRAHCALIGKVKLELGGIHTESLKETQMLIFESYDRILGSNSLYSGNIALTLRWTSLHAALMV